MSIMRIAFAVIRFEEPFRVGKAGLMDTLDYIPSDTVYSALENLNHLGISHGIDKVSSIYPMVFRENGRDSFTVPIPIDLKLKMLNSINKYASNASDVHTVLKYIKKLKYMPLDCIHDSNVEMQKFNGQVKLRCSGREFIYIENYGSRISIQRNVIGRVLNSANTYRVAAFQPYVNYVFYFTVKEGVDLSKVRSSLEVLGKVGIGGERSIGLGYFTVVNIGYVDDLRDSGNNALLLGTALPSRQEVTGYVNFTVRSWICSNPFYVIGPVTVLTDGSVVSKGDLNFETLTGPNCIKKLDPLWLWYEASY